MADNTTCLSDMMCCPWLEPVGCCTQAECPNDGKAESTTLQGVLISMIGNLLISIALTTQKRAHNNLHKEAEEAGTEVKAYWRSPLWAFGLVCMACGEIGNFAAYGFAPATLVAPLGSVSVVSNAVLAHLVLKESLHKRNVLGCALALTGSIFVSLDAPTGTTAAVHGICAICVIETDLGEAPFLIYLAILLASLAYLLFFLPKDKREKVVVYDCLICALFGAITVMCTKGLSETVRLVLFPPAGYPNPAAPFIHGHWAPFLFLPLMVGTIVMQMRFLNHAMQKFGASEVVPVYFVLFSLSSVIAGMVLYREYKPNTLICCGYDELCTNTCDFTWALFLFGILLTFVGVFFIVKAPAQSGSGFKSFKRFVFTIRTKWLGVVAVSVPDLIGAFLLFLSNNWKVLTSPNLSVSASALVLVLTSPLRVLSSVVVHGLTIDADNIDKVRYSVILGDLVLCIFFIAKGFAADGSTMGDWKFVDLAIAWAFVLTQLHVAWAFRCKLLPADDLIDAPEASYAKMDRSSPLLTSLLTDDEKCPPADDDVLREDAVLGDAEASLGEAEVSDPGLRGSRVERLG